jgi:cytochrome c
MKRQIFAAVAVAALVVAGAAHAAGDAEAGRDVFKKCTVCHAAEAGKNKIGPSLFAIVGRTPGGVATFNYSDAMKGMKQAWTPEQLDVYLTDPRALVPGSKMIFPGLKDETDRQNVIAYLATLK